MKKILLLLMLLMTVAAEAQRVDKPGEPYDYFVTVQGSENLKNQIRIEILWSDTKYRKNLRDSNGNKIEFNSLSDIFNYMSKRGWSYVAQYTNAYVWNFIFKKTVTSDEQAKEFFYFEEDFKK